MFSATVGTFATGLWIQTLFNSLHLLKYKNQKVTCMVHLYDMDHDVLCVCSEDVRSANIICNENDTQCLVVDRE